MILDLFFFFLLNSFCRFWNAHFLGHQSLLFPLLLWCYFFLKVEELSKLKLNGMDQVTGEYLTAWWTPLGTMASFRLWLQCCFLHPCPCSSGSAIRCLMWWTSSLVVDFIHVALSRLPQCAVPTDCAVCRCKKKKKCLTLPNCNCSHQNTRGHRLRPLKIPKQSPQYLGSFHAEDGFQSNLLGLQHSGGSW